MNRSLLILILAILTALTTLAANASAAQELSVEALVSDAAITAGQPLTLQVRVLGSDQAEQPDLSGLEDFDAIFQGGGQQNSQSVSIINGRVQQQVSLSYVFTWSLRPRRSGALTIPAIPVKSGDRTLMTRPLTIRVGEAREDPDVLFELALEPPSPYVGEPAMLRVTMRVRRSIEDVDLSIRGVEDLFSVPDDGFDSAMPNEQNAVMLLDSRVKVKGSREVINGLDFTTFVAERPIIPERAGSIELSGALACAVLVRRGDGFFDRGEWRRAAVPSNTLKVTVRDLPREGRPAGFNGLVGRITVAAVADPVSLNVGDPMTLRVVVAGSGPMNRVPRPDFKRILGGAGFRVPDDMASPTTSPGQVIFMQTVRPMSAEVTQVPPIEIPYFDPRSGEYAVARSGAIKLSVAPTRVVTTGDAVAAPGTTTPPQRVEDRTGGIAANIESPAVLADQRFDAAKSLRSPVVVAVVAGSPAVYAATLLITVLRRRSTRGVAARRAKLALATARAGLRAAVGVDAPAAISRAITGYVADRFNLPPEGMTPRDCHEHLKALDEERSSKLLTILERCDAARFAGLPAGEIGQLCAEAEQLLGAIDAARKGRS